MFSIRKFWWAALAASAIVGCTPTAEESTPAGGPPATPGPAPAAPEAKAGGGMSADMPPPASSAPKDATEAKPAEPANIEAPKIEAPAPTPAKPDEKKAGADTLSSEEIAEIKKLPEADAALALKQMVCPVSGEHLGGDMGVPIKVSAEGKTFFLCCKSCNKQVAADPKAVVAKLKQ